MKPIILLVLLALGLALVMNCEQNPVNESIEQVTWPDSSHHLQQIYFQQWWSEGDTLWIDFGLLHTQTEYIVIYIEYTNYITGYVTHVDLPKFKKIFLPGYGTGVKGVKIVGKIIYV